MPTPQESLDPATPSSSGASFNCTYRTPRRTDRAERSTHLMMGFELVEVAVHGHFAISQLRGAGSCFAVIELRHEFPARVAGGAEVILTRGELSRDVAELLFQARDPLLECADIGRSAETVFLPSIVTQHVGELLLQSADPLGLPGAAFQGISQIGLQCLPACPGAVGWSGVAGCLVVGGQRHAGRYAGR